METTLEHPKKCGRKKGMSLSYDSRLRQSISQRLARAKKEEAEAEAAADPIPHLRDKFAEALASLQQARREHAAAVQEARLRHPGIASAMYHEMGAAESDLMFEIRKFIAARRDIYNECRQHLLSLGRPRDYACDFARRLTGRR